jgi:hypothetical protein
VPNGAGGQVAQLFSGFGLPQRAPVEQLPSEELRAQVLQETLARLLQQKTASAGSGPGADVETAGPDPAPMPPSPQLWDGSVTMASLEPSGTDEKTRSHGPKIAAALKQEHPLTKFIRVFHLDDLAARCLRALEDDEVAFVIESCQGRLSYAKNPSAVVMIAIKGVASKVGRRYYGSRSGYNSELQRLLEAHSMGGEINKSDKPLEMFVGSPRDDEEEDVVDLEDGDATASARDAKRRKKEAESAVLEITATSAVVGEDDDDEDGLFFVDTGGK